MLNRIEVTEPPNDGRHRLHAEGERQQQRHAVGRAEAGQDADQDAQQHAADHEDDVRHGERDGEAVQQSFEVFHSWRGLEVFEYRAEQAVRQRDLEDLFEHGPQHDGGHERDDERAHDADAALEAERAEQVGR
jgi:hypothetical protein